jgi:hypothetical protein
MDLWRKAIRQMFGHQGHDPHPQIITMGKRRSDDILGNRAKVTKQARTAAGNDPQDRLFRLGKDPDPAIRKSIKPCGIADHQTRPCDMDQQAFDRGLVDQGKFRVTHPASFFRQGWTMGLGRAPGQAEVALLQSAREKPPKSQSGIGGKWPIAARWRDFASC